MPIDPIVSASTLRGRSDVTFFDCRAEASAYAAGHLPGAIHVDLERDLSTPRADPRDGGRHPLPEVRALAARLGALGVTPNTHVVAYDDQHGAHAAARLWWLLRALGHARVQVVDGGLPALQEAGFTLTAEPVTPESAPPYPTRAYQLPTADLAEVDWAREQSDCAVLDVRAAPRFRGEVEPIDPVAGHIPGAHNVPYTENLTEAGTFKSAEALRAQYEAALPGITPERLIVHCGSGVTACHTLLALERAGLSGAKLYVGSWSEWCRHPELPRATAS